MIFNPQSKSGQKTLKLGSGQGLLFLSVGLLLIGWLLNTPPGLLGKANAVGYAVCHQIDVRSFHLDGRPLSLCARCTGMYLGAVLGLVFQLAIGRRRTGWPRKGILAVLALFFLAFAVDGANSAAKLFIGQSPLYQPHNTLRLITGTGMGLVLAAAVLPAFNQSVWRQYDTRPTIDTWRSFALLLGLSAVLVLLVLTENPILLFPLSLVSAAGVLILLTMIYTLLALAVLKRENLFEASTELIVPLVGGFLVALLQISLLDIVRFFLTGTWDGFHLFLG